MSYPPSSAVLVLHGGKVTSHARSRPWHLSRIRMWPFVWALRRALPGTPVIMVSYRYRGFNGDERSPVRDAEAVLVDIAGRYPGIDVVLVGHSMGGRVAAALAGHQSVSAVVALAPWWQRERTTSIDEPSETDNFSPGQSVLVIHGSEDSWTSPIFSHEVTERLISRGVNASYISIAGGGHFMMSAPWRWTRYTVDFVRRRCGRDGTVGDWENSGEKENSDGQAECG